MPMNRMTIVVAKGFEVDKARERVDISAALFAHRARETQRRLDVGRGCQPWE